MKRGGPPKLEPWQISYMLKARALVEHINRKYSRKALAHKFDVCEDTICYHTSRAKQKRAEQGDAVG